MNLLLVVIYLLQIVGTPVANGSLIISNEVLKFPALPSDHRPVPINDDWELLYYEVHSGRSQYSIRGEVRNISESPLSAPTLIATLANGRQLGIHLDIDQVGAGERAPFQQSFYDEEITAALNQSKDVAFSGVCEYYSAVPEQSFSWSFGSTEIEYDPTRSTVRVSGTVTNIGDASSERYAPMLFGFTTDGHYVGSIAARDIPATIFSGDEIMFEMDHGFNTYSSNEPFSGAGREAVFVLAMAPPVYVSLNCVG